MDLSKDTDVKGTVLVEFFAPWCPHCRKMMPIVQALKDIYDGRMEILQVDADAHEDVARRYGVESFPTWIIYRDGRQMWRDTGEMTAEDLEEVIERNI